MKNIYFLIRPSYQRIAFLVLCILMVTVPGVISAQSGKQQIKGQVLDGQGDALIGVAVRNLMTSTGVITDIDGFYAIEAQKGEILEFSYVGYNTVKKEVANSSSISIVMTEDVQSLDEVVVVGMGTQRKASVIGSIASVRMADLKVPSRSLENALVGRMAGIIGVQRSGETGQYASIFWIRGISTFGANQDPLVLVDGVERSMTNISPEEIESVSILKDASATAVYGVRAANGVVLITTKRGKSGKPVIEIDGSYAFQTPTNIPDFLNATQWREFANNVADNSGIAHAPENDNPTYPDTNTDWAKEWIQYAPMWNLNASISGGGENSTFSTSLGYLDQTGMTIYSDYKRYNFRVNSSYKKGIFSLSENIAITHRDKTPTTAFNISLPTLPIYDSEGRFFSGGGDYYINPEDGKAQNKIAPLHYTDRYNKVTDIIGAITAQLGRIEI